MSNLEIVNVIIKSSKDENFKVSEDGHWIYFTRNEGFIKHAVSFEHCHLDEGMFLVVDDGYTGDEGYSIKSYFYNTRIDDSSTELTNQSHVESLRNFADLEHFFVDGATRVDYADINFTLIESPVNWTFLG